jgi:hypothetical protein
MSSDEPYDVLAMGECKNYRYDYFVAFGGLIMIKKYDYIAFYDGRRWFRGYFKGYMLRVCRRKNGSIVERHFISLLSYEDRKWVDVLVSFDKVVGIAEPHRRERGMWVLVFPRDGRKCVGFNDRGEVRCYS